jgi:hypothetical protein
MIKGAEQHCICDKPRGRHRKYCDAFRVSEIIKEMASFVESARGKVRKDFPKLFE